METISILDNLLEISKYLGKNPAYIQGGGGNISVKVDDQKMHIKASGLKLKDLKKDFGFVSVDYKKIKSSYLDLFHNKDFFLQNSSSDNIVKDNVLYKIGDNSLRPSIETGFHVLLNKYVLHSHSVYANILNCSIQGKSLIESLFKEAIYVPYYTPGITLTAGINKNLKEYKKNKILTIFLENHGIIISGDDPREIINRHEEVSNKIRNELNILLDYPEVSIKKISSNKFISNSPYIKNFIEQNKKIVKKFNETILFPDQVVYGSDISYNKNLESKIFIDTENAAIFYKSSESEAKTFEEIFMSWVYIISNIFYSDFEIKSISSDDGKIISGMESEKYRKKII